MSTAITAASTKPAQAARVCTTCKKNPLSYNNSTGICGECQRELGGRIRPKKTNGHGSGAQHRERRAVRAAPHLVKPNGADHHDLAHGNGNVLPAEDRGLSPGTPAESRVDLLLAAVPVQDKVRMLSAWLAGLVP